MSKPEHFREFNAEHAKAGAPYGCADGQDATVTKYDGRDPRYPLVGFFGEHDRPVAWANNGRFAYGEESPVDLVMLPLGFIDGKPVFVGDKYLFDASPAEALPIKRNFDCCRWPAPAKQYPITAMTKAELNAAFNACSIEFTSLQRVANAAIKHVIDHGQLPTKEAYDQCNAQLAAAEQALAMAGYVYEGGEWRATAFSAAPALSFDYRAKLLNLVSTYFTNNVGENVYNLMESVRAHFTLNPNEAKPPAPSQPAGAAKGRDGE